MLFFGPNISRCTDVKTNVEHEQVARSEFLQGSGLQPPESLPLSASREFNYSRPLPSPLPVNHGNIAPRELSEALNRASTR